MKKNGQIVHNRKIDITTYEGVPGISNHRLEFGKRFHWLILSWLNGNWMVGGFFRRPENL